VSAFQTPTRRKELRNAMSCLSEMTWHLHLPAQNRPHNTTSSSLSIFKPSTTYLQTQHTYTCASNSRDMASNQQNEGRDALAQRSSSQTSQMPPQGNFQHYGGSNQPPLGGFQQHQGGYAPPQSFDQRPLGNLAGYGGNFNPPQSFDRRPADDFTLYNGSNYALSPRTIGRESQDVKDDHQGDFEPPQVHNQQRQGNVLQDTSMPPQGYKQQFPSSIPQGFRQEPRNGFTQYQKYSGPSQSDNQPPRVNYPTPLQAYLDNSQQALNNQNQIPFSTRPTSAKKNRIWCYRQYCGNCQGRNHQMRHCFDCADDGYMNGCQKCNTLNHEFIDCLARRQDGEEDYYFARIMRKNKPPIRLLRDVREVRRYDEKGEDITDPADIPWTPQCAVFNRRALVNFKYNKDHVNEIPFRDPLWTNFPPPHFGGRAGQAKTLNQNQQSFPHPLHSAAQPPPPPFGGQAAQQPNQNRPPSPPLASTAREIVALAVTAGYTREALAKEFRKLGRNERIEGAHEMPDFGDLDLLLWNFDEVDNPNERTIAINERWYEPK
jgi:hypothetical protein